LAFFNLWLFVWDDEIERAGYEADDSGLGGKPVPHLQEEALEYIAYHLGLLDPATPEPAPPTKSMLIIKGPCIALKADCRESTRRRFWEELKFYMKCCNLEYEHLRCGVLPSTEDYWQLRLGTSSVYAGCALAEYVAGVNIPDEVFSTESNKKLWLEVNRHVVL